MSLPPSESLYFVHRTTLSRAGCSWKEEYFCLTPPASLTSVSVYEDKTVFRSTYPHLWLPAGSRFCVATDYEKALTTAKAYERKVQAEIQAAKDARKLLHNRAQAAPAQLAPAPVVIEASPAELLGDFTVLDLEFQGTDLLEIAAIRYQNWQPVGQFVSFVRFRGDIGFHVGKLTGILRDDVWNAPEECEVLMGFKQLIGDSVLVCHNYAADQRVLEAARTRLGATAPLANKWLCTLALAKLRLPKGEKCGLGELCTTFGIPSLGAHRALRDVEMCYQVLRRLHEQQPVTELVISAAKPRKVGQVSLFAAAA